MIQKNKINYLSYSTIFFAIILPHILIWFLVRLQHNLFYTNVIVISLYITIFVSANMLFNYLETGNCFTLSRKKYEK